MNKEQKEKLKSLEDWIEYYWNRFRKTKDQKYLEKFEEHRIQITTMAQFGIELRNSTKKILREFGLLFRPTDFSRQDSEISKTEKQKQKLEEENPVEIYTVTEDGKHIKIVGNIVTEL